MEGVSDFALCFDGREGSEAWIPVRFSLLPVVRDGQLRGLGEGMRRCDDNSSSAGF